MTETSRAQEGLPAARSRIVQVGISTECICGVRDCATLLATAFAERGVEAPLLWCEISGRRPRADRAMVREWRARIRARVRSGQTDSVLLHYSAFAFGWRGLSNFAPPLSRELGSLGVPILGFFHELAYPFGRRGLRGTIQALAQHVALRPVLQACDAAVVTTEQRLDWLLSARWLPRRPAVFVPIPSNLPPVGGEVVGTNERLVVALVGYGSPGASVTVVAEAVARLHLYHHAMTLLLVGAPGPEGSPAARWRRELDARECSAVLKFTGIQPRDRLARALAGADLVVFPDRSGPDSRSGMLSAALAGGKPVLAFDGPETWRPLGSEAAVALVPHNADALAKELLRYASDASLRAAQGESARSFYSRWSSPDAAVEKVLDVLAVAATSRLERKVSAL